MQTTTTTMSREEWARIMDLSKKIHKETGYHLIDNSSYAMIMKARQEELARSKEGGGASSSSATTATTPESVISLAPASVEGTDTK